MASELFAPHILLSDGWHDDVRLTLDDDGTIIALAADAHPAGAAVLGGPVIPGMPDIHCHAFQRAMAGLAERAAPGGDDFWGWRRLMYDLQARLDPDGIRAVATQLYVELLKQGYTAVGEFHYLHHQPGGAPYAQPSELSVAVVSAALAAGIAITHLPVLYAHAGFGEESLGAAQARFRGDAEFVWRIVEDIRSQHRASALVRAGVAPHSLRAVSPALLAELAAAARAAPEATPVHIHVAEQVREVEDCVGWSGRRPVAWLLDNVAVDADWCLVHATHVDDEEIAALAASGAVVGLCPTTEANLGDGIFPLAELDARGGRFGIGSDSNVSRSPVEELRWLEYGQRLTRLRRNVLAGPDDPSTGARLWRRAAADGARALAQPSGTIELGRRADLVVLDGDAVELASRAGDALLDALIFAGNRNLVRDVRVGGRAVVTDRRHTLEEEARGDFVAAVGKLL